MTDGFFHIDEGMGLLSLSRQIFAIYFLSVFKIFLHS